MALGRRCGYPRFTPSVDWGAIVEAGDQVLPGALEGAVAQVEALDREEMLERSRVALVALAGPVSRSRD